jgi:two-component system, chemotaxis family, protein-glutamate methylesterase/glutaminase
MPQTPDEGLPLVQTTVARRREPRVKRAFDVVAMAASLGGLDALIQVLGALPPTFPAPILVVQHLSARFPSHLVELLDRCCALPIAWAQSGQLLRPGAVYIAPPDQHLLIGMARRARLSRSPHVQFVRPSADVLFESVATTYRERAIAVVLTGRCNDGAHGVCAIKRAGGRVLTQDEATCAAFGMPRAAIASGCVDFVLPLPTIAPALLALTMVQGAAALLNRPARGMGPQNEASGYSPVISAV